MTKKRTSDSPGGAGRITPGDIITARELTTIKSERILLPAPGILTHLQFRRYAGCPICNLHLHTMARRHDEIAAAGIQEIVVFHSAAADMLPFLSEESPADDGVARRAQAERERILSAWSGAHGNKSRLAQLLGVSRKTLYARLRRLQIAL